ncbi:TPA: HAD family hydrolase [Streptococcus suis]
MTHNILSNLDRHEPTLAICYDFDKTLSTDDMQAHGFIPDVGEEIPEFWKSSNSFAELNNMDQILSYMYKMKEASSGKLLFTKDVLTNYGKSIMFFQGVESWFQRINKYGEQFGVKIEHYIISSGLKEMIEGTSIGKEFKKIYATSFLYDNHGVAVWPAQVVNYTNKTQFLFRISKGILDINSPKVNDYMDSDMVPIPFRNMVYIGDSATDIPCMKLVNVKGGFSIGVYNPNKNQESVVKMMRENRISYFTQADYRENSDLDQLLKLIIEKVSVNEKLVVWSQKNKVEADVFPLTDTEKKLQTEELFEQLNKCKTYTQGIDLVGQISQYRRLNDWSQEDLNKLVKIASDNPVINNLIESEEFIKLFFDGLLNKIEVTDNNLQDLLELEKTIS